MIRSIAVIGVGAMGAPIARRLRAAGYALTVCDRHGAAVAALAAEGANVAPSAADCAAADLALILVATAQQVREVIIGTQGLMAGVAAGLCAGRSPIVVVMSTVSAEVLDEVARQLPAEVTMIDAPVSGGTRGAEQGSLTMLTGGDEAAIERVAPVLDQLASQRIHCGRLGAAQTMKILNNALGQSIAVIAGEVYRLAIERGLDTALLSRVLEACSGRNARSKNPAGPQAGYGDLAKDPATFEGIAAIFRKDIGLAGEMASRTPGEYPAIRRLEALIASLGPETYGTWRRIAEAPSTKA